MAKTYNSIEEFNVALQSAFDGLSAEIGTFMPSLSTKLAGDIRKRVTMTGRDSEGGSFTAYSEGHKKKKRAKGNAPYGKITSFKNFFFSGDMWQNFDFRSATVSGNVIKSHIGFAGQNVYTSNNNLHEYHSWEGASKSKHSEGKDISAPNSKEEEALVNELGNAIGEYLTRILG